MSQGYRTFVKFDSYELALLRKLKKEVAEQHKAEGKKPPSMSGLIRGCVRTAIHSVYGEEYAYKELLSEEQFEKLMAGSDTQG